MASQGLQRFAGLCVVFASMGACGQSHNVHSDSANRLFSRDADANTNVPPAAEVPGQSGRRSWHAPATQLLYAGETWARSSWVGFDAQRNLRYGVDAATQSTLPQFASAGYHNGGAALPNVPPQRRLAPCGADDTALIQAALDAIGGLPVDANGHRGSLQLSPGTFVVSAPLQLRYSGVVLQGTASVGANKTVLQYTGTQAPMVHIVGDAAAAPAQPQAAQQWRLLPEAQPAGSSRIALRSSTGLAVGDAVRLQVSHNQAWFEEIWGGSYPPLRDGQAQPAWGDALVQRIDRRIAAIDADGVHISLDAPLPDALVAPHFATDAGAFLQRPADAVLREVGLAHMQLQGRFIPGAADPNTLLTMAVVEHAEDVWLDDIVAHDFGMAFVVLGPDTRRVTVQDAHFWRSDVQSGAALPFDISLAGQQALVQGCSSHGEGSIAVATQGFGAMGPNVVQNYRAAGALQFAPHQRWSTATLFDNIYAPHGGIGLRNRGNAGSGHGWAAAYSVVYNSLAGTQAVPQLNLAPGESEVHGLCVEQPPTAANWGIGLLGPDLSPTASARYESAQVPVSPVSLYAAQLWQDKGDAAMATIVGPWQITSAAQGGCLAARTRKAGSLLRIADCKALGQAALWDITSFGSVRLAGSNLCLDASDQRAGEGLRIMACDESALQHWQMHARDGSFMPLRNKVAADGAQSRCVGVYQGGTQLVPCDAYAQRWQLRLSTLARP